MKQSVLADMMIGDVYGSGDWLVECHPNYVLFGKKRFLVYNNGGIIGERVRPDALLKFMKMNDAPDDGWSCISYVVSDSYYVDGIGTPSQDTVVISGVSDIENYKSNFVNFFTSNFASFSNALTYWFGN